MDGPFDVAQPSNGSDEIPFTLLCRVCGQTHENLVPIFEGEGSENNLAEKIHSYLPIKVDVEDGLPLQLCYQCASALLAWHNFIQNCIDTNIALNSRLSKSQPSDTSTKVTECSDSTLDVSDSSKKRFIPDTDNGSSEHSTRYKNVFVVHNTLGLIKVNIDEKFTPEIVEKCSFCTFSNVDINIRVSHMLDSHPNFFFNCDECGSYIDRSQLIPHMSQHAECDDETTVDRPNCSNENLAKNASTAKSAQKHNKETKNSNSNNSAAPEVENDAFSTSSHSNDRFEPIPDSVFEAIKDTEEPNVDPPPKTLDQSCEDMQKMSEKLSSRNVNSTQTNSRVCPICSKAFRLASSFHYHMKNFHGGVKDYICKVCGRGFGVKSALTNHLTLHSGEKPYSCPACSKQFRSKASIYIHYNNVHCEKKTFACTMCNRSFKWKQKLLRHIASHTKEKKYFCTKCNRGFSVKCDLNRHMKTHVSDKPFYCDKCGMSFSQKRYLKNHTNKKHSVTA